MLRLTRFIGNRRKQNAWRCLAVGMWLILAVTSPAADKFWQVGNGTFSTGSNWQGGVAPGAGDIAHFGRSDPSSPFVVSYTVSFSANATNQALQIEDDTVTFNLNGHLYAVTAVNGIAIGNQPGNHIGSLTISSGTVGSSTNIDVGAVAGATGSLTVGSAGTISGSPSLSIGKLGNGSLTVQSGASEARIDSTGSTTIGASAGITGTANITGAAAKLITNTLAVGTNGIGTVDITAGGLLMSNSTVVVGSGSLFTGIGTGTVNISGNSAAASSTWWNDGPLTVGDGGTGKVNVTGGGFLRGVDTILGNISPGAGEIDVDGTDSSWISAGTVTVGALGSGTLKVTGGAKVQNTFGYLGKSKLATFRGNGAAIVSGSGSKWTNTNDLFVGYDADATLDITNGGYVQNGWGYVGYHAGSNGTVTLDGGGRWVNTGPVVVGNFGTGALTINGGAEVQSGEGDIGIQAGSQGKVNVASTGAIASNWLLSSTLFVGGSGSGILNITSGGAVLGVNASIGSFSGGVGTVNVTGPDAAWHNDIGNLVVGDIGNGTLNVNSVGIVQNINGTIGGTSGSTGTVNVNGSLAYWHNTGSLTVGLAGHGVLNITGGGRVDNVNAIIGSETGSVGEVLVDGPGSTWTSSGTLVVSSFAPGTGTLTVTNGGTVTAQGGLLVRVLGTLRGDGQIVGNVSNVGMVSPGTSPGALHIAGNFAQGASGKLKIDLAGTAPGTQYDQLLVSGSLALAGTLEVSLPGGFQPTSGMTFDILDFGGVSGNFNSILLPAIGGGLVWNTSQLNVAGILSIGLPGDFSGNGVVDAADYIIWRKGLGTTYVQSDYAVWRTHFGQTSGNGAGIAASAAVPEPTSVWMLLLGMLTMCFRRHFVATCIRSIQAQIKGPPLIKAASSC